MRRIEIALMMMAAVFFLAAGGASAGEITATYDLAGSTITTTSPLGVDDDPLTGTITLVFQAATEFANPTMGSVLSGAQHASISQPASSLSITGSTDTAWGTGSALLSGATLTPSSLTGFTTGFLHCFGGLCGLAGFTASVPLPQTQTGPFTLPPLVFTSGAAGVGDFVGTGTTLVTNPVTVTVVTSYTAAEVSRVYVPEPGAMPMLVAGILCLGGLGSAKLRRRR